MRKRIELALLALLLVAVAALVAVRTTGSEVDVRDAGRAHRPGLLLQRIGTWWTGGARPPAARSPEELIRSADPAAIVVGSVEGVDRGRDILGPSPNPGQHVRWQRFLVVRVRVSEVLWGEDSGLIDDGRVYVEVPEGVWVRLEQGSSYELAPIALSKWRVEIPTGTRVMLFLHPDRYDSWPDRYRTRHDDRGLPEDAAPAVIDAPEVVLEYRGQILPYDRRRDRGWNVDSIDQLSDRVRAYLESHG